MKSVNAFFLPAVKKIKYYCEGELSQTSEREQAGELNIKRNNTREGQSTSSQGMQGLWFVLNYMSMPASDSVRLFLQASLFGMI